ncbi:probable mitogen-activated protein kinase kinase kinase 9 at C-terminar half [Coccomyxa sp. Obi]|nr:probable mitogen-activated protein kinase kinase kinase 9 at C-terminar half [Coccomyxa sp. Obi]
MTSVHSSPAVFTCCSAFHTAPNAPHAAREFSLDAPNMAAAAAESVMLKAFSPFCPDAMRAAGSQTDPVFGLPGRRTSGIFELPVAGSITGPGAPDLALGRLIGRGSFGRVYKGEWQGQEVAVKVLCCQDSQEANFEGLSEYWVSKQVRHPNVVETYKVIIGPSSVSQQCCPPDSPTSSSESATTSTEASPRASSAAEANSGLDGDVHFFQDCGQDSNPVPALAAGARHLAAPDARHLAADMAVDEHHLAGDVMAQSAAAHAFAAATAAVPTKPEAEAPALLEHCCGDGFGVGQLHGILDSTSTFTESRAATLPLAPSPFEAALERAMSGNADAAAEPAVRRIARSFSAGRLPADEETAAAAESAPTRPRCGSSSSLGNPTADTQSSWLATRSSIGSDRGAFAAGRSLHARPSFHGLPPRPRRPSSDNLAAMGTALVMEYADLGSLHDAISRGRIKGNLDAVLLCARDVAAGMAYLHSLDIIHSDLKPANVLLKSAQATPSDARGFTCKIADFGMARRVEADRSHTCTDMPGSLPYMAPEVLQAGKITKASDVYSFAILLLELWSGCACHTDQNYYGALYSVLCGCRPSVPADAPAAYRELLEDCWAADPALRPTFTAVLDRLDTLLAAAPEN